MWNKRLFMKQMMLFLLCFFPLTAEAFDSARYPLIDLRARSQRGGLGVVTAQPAAAQGTSQLTGAPSQPTPASYYVQPQQYYAAPPTPVQSAPSKPARETAKDSDDVKEYLKNNPQALPDV